MKLNEYEKEHRERYAAFAAQVASILESAIRQTETFNLQQVQSRAKDVQSLVDKLAKYGFSENVDVAAEVKDLAGCRAIFYSNSDVSRFLDSGIVEENFEVIERKLHHPSRELSNGADLYMANHYVLKLKASRAELAEYISFADLKCELQVQTILNHSWAATAHDTIYKKPKLDDFGAKAIERIEERLAKIAKRYLIPAGYEFDRVLHDFDRLLEGKKLLDGDALQAILDASDNNVRADALETFTENVLPFYDDIPGVWRDILEKLVDAAQVAKTVPQKENETPFGNFPGQSFSDILSKISETIKPYRYIDVTLTFETILALYRLVETDEERKPVLELAETLAKHDLEVWKSAGPVVQEILIDQLNAIQLEEQSRNISLIAEISSCILGSEISGTTWGADVVTLHRGSVVASQTLQSIRSRTIALLESLLKQCSTPTERAPILNALFQATRTSHELHSRRDLFSMILQDSLRVIETLTQIVAVMPFDERQKTEQRVFQRYRWYSVLPEDFSDDDELIKVQGEFLETTKKFREAANADTEFE
ncbi:RelA/SpoT domain-containing protein, partial [Sphingorhabdus sp. Alg239-R122]|uniref:RelA/SpoT domain-containing protein n=1 Tax=Sphingorhabdus sp. Alg239-R122 TaxID=2305989 RepID=UPI001967C2C6